MIIEETFTKEMMTPLFWILKQNIGVWQSPAYHPEGDVFTHSLQALHIAFRETRDTNLILAAMLHDVGKVAGSNGHEKYSSEFCNCYCSLKTLWLIENHMRIWYLLLGTTKKLSKIHELLNHPFIVDLIHLARIDKAARKPTWTPVYDEDAIVNRLNQCVKHHFREK